MALAYTSNSILNMYVKVYMKSRYPGLFPDVSGNVLSLSLFTLILAPNCLFYCEGYPIYLKDDPSNTFLESFHKNFIRHL